MGLSTEYRFQLPDNWEVEGTVCLVVRVPDDPQYIGQLIGLLDALKFSKNFGRDATRTGAATVSRTWAAALESSPIELRECSEMILRQNPDDPCQLEQSTDGGETWELAFDYSLCADVITVPAPYVGSETGASDAAATAIANTLQALLALCDCEGLTRAEYISAATAYMRTFDAGYAAPAALGAIYDEYCGLSAPEQAEYTADCMYIEHKDDIEGCTNSDGLMDWLNCASDTIAAWLTTTSDALMDALNQAAAALSGNGWQNAAAGGAGSGAGFGSGCALTELVTFDAGGYAYTITHGTIIAGGNPDNCIQSVGWFGFGNWQGSSVIKVIVPVGTLDALTVDDRVYSLPTGTVVGVQIEHYDSGDTLIDNASTTHDYALAVGSFYTFAAFTGLGWTIADGDYIVVYVGITTTSEANANATDIRADNLLLEGVI